MRLWGVPVSKPITPQAVVAFLRKNGVPIAKVVNTNLLKPRKGGDQPGARVRKGYDVDSVRVTAWWPFDPARCTAELARMADVLATAFDLEREEHRLIVRAKSPTATTTET